jgi:aldose 1-epimerase
MLPVKWPTLIVVLALSFGWPPVVRGQQPSAVSKATSQSRPIEIGGEPVVVLRRPRSADQNKPQFLEATVVPGRGMAVLQIKAYIPGKGEINLLNTPPLPEAGQMLDKSDDEFGNQVFKFGGAILLPFANRIRGKLSPDGKTITATVAGKPVTLPANWSGNNPGAEKHAIHGLLLNSKFVSVVTDNGPHESSVVASLRAGDFGGHWFSASDIRVEIKLKDDAFNLLVTVRNAGHAPLPMGIGWHPYFVLPGGDRQQVRLHLPSETRAIMNNYDDSFVTGKRVSVKDTPYDFSATGGRALGTQYLDDNFSDLIRNADGSTVSEIIDPAAKYGLRLTTFAPSIKSIQVYAPLNKNFVAIEPQFNLPDPYSKDWGNIATGMVLLGPGQSVDWRVRLGLFTPGE